MLTRQKQTKQNHFHLGRTDNKPHRIIPNKGSFQSFTSLMKRFLLPSYLFLHITVFHITTSGNTHNGSTNLLRSKVSSLSDPQNWSAILCQKFQAFLTPQNVNLSHLQTFGLVSCTIYYVTFARNIQGESYTLNCCRIMYIDYFPGI